MKVLFCDSGFSPKEVDYMYAEEYQAAKDHGFAVALMSFEAIKKGDFAGALRRIRSGEVVVPCIYRGWMLRPVEYQQLYDALLAKNLQLINTPEAYAFCHYLPNNYPTIQAYTAKSVYQALDGNFDINTFKSDLEQFGQSPIIVKDYVKSQKHYWAEACFIPDASDLGNVAKITKRFIELQDVDLNEGIVYREFVELEALTTHTVSGMPLTKEFRLFVKDGHIIDVLNYWDEGDYGAVEPNLDFMDAVIPKIKSNFFTMDIAQKKDGTWIIVELGDGQVSGLPDNASKQLFYKYLRHYCVKKEN